MLRNIPAKGRSRNKNEQKWGRLVSMIIVGPAPITEENFWR